MSVSTTHRNGAVRPGLALAAFGACLLLITAALPVAAAASVPPLGMSVADISGLTSAGAKPRYASYWAGEWMSSSGWGGFDAAMKTAKGQGVTPVVYWYYWGDSISPNCVNYGCSGKSRAEWTTLTGQLASHLRSTLGGAEAIIVLENEFNKHDVDGWYAPTFDGYLEGVAKTLKGVAGVKLVLGFGAWGESNWGKFPKSLAQSDYVGFQLMRASTRDNEGAYRGAADRAAYLTQFVADKFAKPSFLYDLALSSYPDAYWANVQAQTLDAIFSKLASSGSTGLQGVVYRSLKDVWMDPKNYYGAAESHWGLKTSSGAAKPAWSIWLKHAKSATTTPAPAPTPSTSTFSATFSGVKGNDWWVQTSVSAPTSINSVCAMVNGGECKPLGKQSYGWASSFYVASGASVTFRATASDGSTSTSGTYLWPSATLVGSAPSPTAPSTGTATFTPHGGNAWWVQTKVSASQGVKSVCASVNGGSCQALTYQSWGSWAKSISAPTGSRVVFRATLADGSVATSSTYTWPIK